MIPEGLGTQFWDCSLNPNDWQLPDTGMWAEVIKLWFESKMLLILTPDSSHTYWIL